MQAIKVLYFENKGESMNKVFCSYTIEFNERDENGHWCISYRVVKEGGADFESKVEAINSLIKQLEGMRDEQI